MQNYKDRYIRNDPRKTNECCQILWSDNYKKLNKYKNLASEHGCLGDFNTIEGFANSPNASANANSNINNNKIQSHYDINGVKCQDLCHSKIQIVNNNKIGKKVELDNNEKLNVSGDIGVNRYDYNKDNYNKDNYIYLKDEDKRPKTKINCKYGNKFEIERLNNQEKYMYDINLPTLMKKEILGNVKEIDNIYNNKIVSVMSYDQMHVENMKNVMTRLNYNLEDTVIRANEANSLNDPFYQNMFL